MNYIFNKIYLRLLILFGLSLIVRLVIFNFYPDQKFLDSTHYEIAGFDFFKNNFVFPTDVHMPLYPILSYLFGRTNMILIDILLSSLTTLLIYYLCLYLFDEFSALIASLISIFYPFFIFYSLSGLTETLFIFLQLSYFILLYKKKYIYSFILIVLSIYVRPSLDYFYPLIIFSFLFFVHKEKPFKILKYLFLYILVYSIMLFPWWVHNYKKYDTFVRTNLALGKLMYIGNNSLNESGGSISGVDVDLTLSTKITNDIERYKYFTEETLDFIINNPKNFAQLSGKRFIRFWRFYPYTNHYNNIYYSFISIVSFVPILLFSFFSLFKIGRIKIKELFPIFITILSLTAVHTISISSIRYRLPLEPFLIILASSFISINIKKLIKKN